MFQTTNQVIYIQLFSQVTQVFSKGPFVAHEFHLFVSDVDEPSRSINGYPRIPHSK